jgi:deoxyribose-phosphate aldolase
MKLNELVEKYIKLRDQKAAYKAEYDAKVAGIDALLEKMEVVLLKTFEEAGMDSVKTSSGTAYRTTRTSATVADWDAFLAYVKAHDAFELVERRCSKSAVEQFKAANDDLPPGLNWRAEQVVNVRRSS